MANSLKGSLTLSRSLLLQALVLGQDRCVWAARGLPISPFHLRALLLRPRLQANLPGCRPMIWGPKTSQRLQRSPPRVPPSEPEVAERWHPRPWHDDRLQASEDLHRVPQRPREGGARRKLEERPPPSLLRAHVHTCSHPGSCLETTWA